MSAQTELIGGTERDLGKSQWFTPPELAAKVVEWAHPDYCLHGHKMRVLEPSAGNGALVRPLLAAGAEVAAVEMDARYQLELETFLRGPHRPLIWNFLECTTGGLGSFDLCVMNPPYENGLDVQFILHALKFAPRVVGIFRSALLHGQERKAKLWSQVRPTRIAFLAERPKFGEGGGARSDFIVCELQRAPQVPAEMAARATLEWW